MLANVVHVSEHRTGRHWWISDFGLHNKTHAARIAHSGRLRKVRLKRMSRYEGRATRRYVRRAFNRLARPRDTATEPLLAVMRVTQEPMRFLLNGKGIVHLKLELYDVLARYTRSREFFGSGLWVAVRTTDLDEVRDGRVCYDVNPGHVNAV